MGGFYYRGAAAVHRLPNQPLEYNGLLLVCRSPRPKRNNKRYDTQLSL